MTIPVFPTLPGISWPVKRTPVWFTLAQRSTSGIETRLQVWSYPQYAYELTFEVLRSSPAFTEWQQMEAFYNQCGGSAQMFAFNDPADCAVTAQGFGTGNGSTTAFQLVRSLGGFVCPVFAPVAWTAYVNGVAAVGATVSARGVVTFASAPAAGAVLTWTGTYNWFCRFDDDKNTFSQDMNQLWSLASLKFTTVKL